jgi:hypothetical protein
VQLDLKNSLVNRPYIIGRKEDGALTDEAHQEELQGLSDYVIYMADATDNVQSYL